MLDDSWKDPTWRDPSWDVGHWRKHFNVRAETEVREQRRRWVAGAASIAVIILYATVLVMGC